MRKPPRPTAMQAKAMELIREGVRPVQAMREAGYTEEVSQAPKRNLLSRPGAQTIIEQYKDAYTAVGITPAYMAEKTKEWLDWEGRPDVQQKAAEMVRKDWGMAQEATTPGGVAVQVNITRGE